MSKETKTEKNPAVEILLEALMRRRPQPKEPVRYANPAHAFGTLRRYAYLTQEQMAFKLFISKPMLEKIETGAYGGSPQIATVERAIELAKDYFLPGIATYLKHYYTHLRMKPRRGPRPASYDEVWYNPEREGVS